MTSRRPRLRRALPLGAYLFGTLGVPLLNGAAADARYFRHALSVAGAACLVFLALECGSRLVRKAFGLRSALAVPPAPGPIES